MNLNIKKLSAEVVKTKPFDFKVKDSLFKDILRDDYCKHIHYPHGILIIQECKEVCGCVSVPVHLPAVRKCTALLSQGNKH